MKLFICIATFNRRDYLSQLLVAINSQLRPVNCDLTVTISDNDALGSSEAVVDQMRSRVQYPIRYSVEGRKGISQNRNNSVRMVDADADFVLFVDDDELPDENWLIALLRIQRETSADVVSGLSLPRFVSPPPAWISRGNFFTRPLYATLKNGDPLLPRNVMTGTLLVSYPALQKLTGPFDERYGLTGGEDSDLGRRLAANRCRMVWAKDAVVREWIPDDRATLSWVLQRAFRTANTLALLERNSALPTKAIMLTMGLGRLVFALVLLLPALLLAVIVGFHPLVKLLRIGYRGVGVIGGLFGIAYEEYSTKRTTPTPRLLPNLSK